MERTERTGRSSSVSQGAAQRPAVTLSYAQSLDGSITHQRGRPLALSGPESLRFTHRLRSEHDAILIGVGTVLADNPRLTVRLVDGSDPRSVILDSGLRTPPQAALLQSPARGPWILTTAAAPANRRSQLEQAGARVVELAADTVGRISLPAALQFLDSEGIRSLMVEGGARVIAAFLGGGVVDRLIVTISPVLVGGLRAIGGPLRQGIPEAAAGPLLSSEIFPHLLNVRYEQLGSDLVVSGRLAAPRR